MTGGVQLELITLEDLGVKIDPDYYSVEVGDFCSHCKTPVTTQWSGIACSCGRLWYCL